MTPVQNVIVENDEGIWFICLEDDLGSHIFVCDPQLVSDALRPWRLWKEEGEQWRGVYPGMCIDPNTCRGKTHCPRDYSCCE